MINSENIYLLAKLLNCEIKVERDGIVFYYRYINNKLCKIIKNV